MDLNTLYSSLSMFTYCFLFVLAFRIYERIVEAPSMDFPRGTNIWLGQRNDAHGFFRVQHSLAHWKQIIKCVKVVHLSCLHLSDLLSAISFCQGVMQDVQLVVVPHGYIVQCPDLNRSKCMLSVDGTGKKNIYALCLLTGLEMPLMHVHHIAACPTCNDFHGLVQKIMELQDILAKTSNKASL